MRGRIFFLLFTIAAITAAFAADPSVTAVLSSSETVVGQPVELQIRITGASKPKPPGDINVDGLAIRSAGVSQNYEMRNFSVSYSFTYNYNIMPLKAGSYKIPSQSVETGGKTLRTPELSLNVAAASSPTQPSRAGRGTSSNIDPTQIGFIEMIVPKAIAYVGEMIPVQIRVGINMRAPVESLGGGIQIAGQGFTTQKFTEPRQTVETINGRSYQVFIFKTAIAPVRSGKLDLGPAEITPVVRVPLSGQRNPSLPRDLFDDPFFNNFFNDPAFAPSKPQEISLKSQGATLEVKPLPPHPPSTFSGAVGSFSLKVDALPKKAQIGDPITVTAILTGRGNFDRVTDPALLDEGGWHKYPPSDKFAQDDDVGISGTKTFETVFSAKERKDKLPPLVFSFFDPVKENYVTLQSEPIPLTIEGGAAPTAPPAVAAAPTATAPPATSAAPTPKQEQDILYQLTERPARPQSFTPMYKRREFWLAQLLPLLALLGFIAVKVRARHSDNREAQRIARLQHEAAEVHRRLRRDDVAPNEYLADASRAVQLKAALARNVDPNAVDAESAANAFQLDEQKRDQLRQLFSQSDEMRYSGGRNGGQQITPEKRREILELVENLR